MAEAEKRIKVRQLQKINTSANWEKAEEKGFIPLKGEIIIYSDLQKFKVGDGVSTVGALGFMSGGSAQIELDTTLSKAGKAADAKAVGDKIAQINTATKDWSGITNKPSISSGSGYYSIRENDLSNNVAGNYSHAEGQSTEATGTSHAEGYDTTASNYSHAEGVSTQATGRASHAEGEQATASGTNSHAEGFGTVAGNYSHAEGDHTYAITGSHAEGVGTWARGAGQHVQGKYNLKDEGAGGFTYAHIVGNGTSDTKRRNIHTLDWDGNAWFAGDVYTGSTSGIQKDEGSKILATKEYVDDSLQELKDTQLGVQEKIVAEQVLISKESDGFITNYSLFVDGTTYTQNLLTETIAADSISLTDIDEEGLDLSTSLDASGIRTNGDYFVFSQENGEEICSVLGNKAQINQHAQEIQKIKEEYYNPDNLPDYPVDSVNGKTGDVTLTAEDVGAMPNTTTIPTKVSQLTNDSGFITGAPISKIRVVRVPSTDEGGQPGSIKLEENTVYQFLSGSEPKVLKCYNSNNEVTTTLSYQMFTIYCGGMGDNNDLVAEDSLDNRAKQAYLVYIANNTKSNSILGLPDYDAGYMVFKKNWPGTDEVNETFRVEVSYPAGSVYMIQSQEG